MGDYKIEEVLELLKWAEEKEIELSYSASESVTGFKVFISTPFMRGETIEAGTILEAISLLKGKYHDWNSQFYIDIQSRAF